MTERELLAAAAVQEPMLEDIAQAVEPIACITTLRPTQTWTPLQEMPMEVLAKQLTVSLMAVVVVVQTVVAAVLNQNLIGIGPMPQVLVPVDLAAVVSVNMQMLVTTTLLPRLQA